MNTCTLCGLEKAVPLIVPNDERLYHYCYECYLIFVDSVFHLDQDQEKKILINRKQNIKKEDYVAYISSIITMVRPYVKETDIGLDYGCGPTPTLTLLLKNENLTCFNNDKIFNFTHPFKQYDFILAIECMGKFKEPNKEFDEVLTYLKPGGILGVMTELYHEKDYFKFWHKRKDKTHISYYHPSTMAYFTANKQLQILASDDKRVYIFKKSRVFETPTLTPIDQNLV